MKREKHIIFVKPVKRYAIPKYPTKTEANSMPELLRKLPLRWQKNTAVIAAIGMFGAMTLTSCGIFEFTNNTSTGNYSESENFLNVAPIFVHGEGTGSMGCVMIAPSVFLSEQEAIAIIKSEVESAKLYFNSEPPKYTASNNKPEQTSKYSWEQSKYVLGDGNIGLDLYDVKKGVAVTFVSMEEAEVKYDGMSSSVTSYFPHELAELTAKDFSQQNGDITVGIFYDPGQDWENEQYKQMLDEYNTKTNELYEKFYDENNPDEYYKKMDEAREEYISNIKLFIEENLREQIRDFIEWLQGQGII